MTTPERCQDMPPPGGYKKIPYARVPAKTLLTGYQTILGYFGITAAGLYIYYLNYKDVQHDQVEMRSARLALHPFLLAERDREYLKQLRRNREEEESLMANVKGWKVGTWYGEPIYKTKPSTEWVDPTYKEFYVHTDDKTFMKRAFLKLMC